MTNSDKWRKRLCGLAVFVVLLGLTHGSVRAARPVELPDGSLAPAGDPREMPCAAPDDWARTQHWIEVSLREQVVRLCEGQLVVGEYLAATGRGDTRDTTTFPGLFIVYEKNAGPFLLREHGVYITHWVGFDQEHNNGFHSMPKDARGRVLDSRLGQPVSHGCVRTAQPAQVFKFAEFGMTVWVHQ